MAKVFLQIFQVAGKVNYLALLCSAALALRYISQLRLNRKLATLERQRAINHERYRISRDMHDELGSGLTMISLMSELAKKNINNPKGISEIEKISESSRAMIDHLQEIVWSLNPQNDNLKNLAIYLRQYIVNFFNETSINCTIRLPKSIPDLMVSGTSRRNIVLIVKEALNNLLKHSSATELVVGLKVHDQSFQIIIHDNGQGMHTLSTNTRGNGISNMKRRMKEIGGEFDFQSQITGGTTLVLKLPTRCLQD